MQLAVSNMLFMPCVCMQETMTRAPPKQFTMAPYQVMLDRVSRTIGDNMDIKAREVQVAAA